MSWQAVGETIRQMRLDAGMTQVAFAQAIGQPQSLVSKIESGERTVRLDELPSLASALGVSMGRVVNAISEVESVLDRWDMTEGELTELIDENPSLRGMMMGYAAEVKFSRMFLKHRPDIIWAKDDDHDRKKKGDRRLLYRGKELVVEVKSLQTKTVKRLSDNQWFGQCQVDGSDRRLVKFADGTSLVTTLLQLGEFDILAVNCFVFGDEWRFVFALNSDLATSDWPKYTSAQRSKLIKSMQDIHLPAKIPFTEDFDDVLERAWQLKTA
jgi:transcriptional regulator with XRE-family HTH domain